VPAERQLQLLSASWVDVGHGESHQRQSPFGDQRGGAGHQLTRRGEDRSCRGRGGRQGVGAGGTAEIVESHSQHHRAPRPLGGAHPPGYPIDEFDDDRVDLGVRPRTSTATERALRAHRTPAHTGQHAAAVDVAGQAIQLTAHCAACHRRENGLGKFGDLCDRLDPVAAQLLGGLGADAPQPPHRKGMQKLQLAARRDHQQTVGLALLAGEFRQELCAGDPHGDGQAYLIAHASPQSRADSRGLTGRPPQTAHTEECLVDRDRFDQRGGIAKDRKDSLAGPGVRRHPRRDDDGMWAQVQGLPAAHRGTHAIRLGLVAGGEDYATPDDDGAAAQLGVIALLDRCIEGIQVGVHDGGTGHERMFAPAGDRLRGLTVDRRDPYVGQCVQGRVLGQDR
jgi:hypothetical protein